MKYMNRHEKAVSPVSMKFVCLSALNVLGNSMEEEYDDCRDKAHVDVMRNHE